MARTVLVIHGAGELVGHSFGASVILEYLCEAVPRPSLSGLFLVATPFWGPDFPDFALPPDFAARLRGVSPLFLYHSRDDSVIPVADLRRFRRALPWAVVRTLDGRGHEFAQQEFPELVDDIRRAVGTEIPKSQIPNPTRTPTRVLRRRSEAP